MKKRSLWVGGVALAFASLCVGILITARLDWNKPLPAVESLQSGERQAVFGASSLPTFSTLAKKVGPSVVNISTTKVIKRQAPGLRRYGPRDPFFDDFFDKFFEGPGGGSQSRDRPQKSLGSGFIINNDGTILTNNHVIEGADEIQVQLTDKRKLTAKVIGSDPKTDLAVIKVTGKDLPTAALGDSDQIQVGDWVMAVGNPFGLEHTVTVGIISAKGRVIGAGPYDDFLQTDASINPGNSGGPLFNLQGEVIGVNSAIVASGQGIGFAIPINMAKSLVPQLISSGKVTRAWLGVGIQEMTPELAKSFNLPNATGALVSNVFPDSPAAKGGMRGGLKTGDIIIALNGKTIREAHELPALVAREPVGKKVTLKVLREGKEQDLEVTLGEMEKGEKVATESTRTTTGDLGIACRDLMPEEARSSGSSPGQRGVVIVGVDPGSAADNAGVQRGDLLLSLNNLKLNSVADFSAAAKKIKKGEIVRLLIKRDEATIYLAFTN